MLIGCQLREICERRQAGRGDFRPGISVICGAVQISDLPDEISLDEEIPFGIDAKSLHLRSGEPLGFWQPAARGIPRAERLVQFPRGRVPAIGRRDASRPRSRTSASGEEPTTCRSPMSRKNI